MHILLLVLVLASVQSGSTFQLVTPVLGPQRLPDGSTTTEFSEGYINLGPPGLKAMLVLHPGTELYKRIATQQGKRLVLTFSFETVD